MNELFDDINVLLAERRVVLEDRKRFRAAMSEAEYHDELWSTIRPLLRSPEQYRAGAAFMAAMLRERSRD